MLVGTREDGGFVPKVRDICDGCNDKPSENHECSGIINAELVSKFPKRECNCNDCKK